MAKVRLLEKTVAERIAAGEVIERPASIIKELVENSLDAGATRIIVEIKAGGIKALRVSDNGCGMSADDMALAIQRFATSKITDWNDLASLNTLGFRGEALPSIAAVARMRIKSCLPEQEGGAELYVEGAGVPLIKPCACPPGTRIEVSDLFYNTPARLKFLRSPVAEATNIIDMLGRMAVAHPEVHFRLISNDKEVFSFPIGMAMPQRLVKLWKIPDNTLIPIAKAVGDMVIDGYVALPYYTRNNRNNQLILLNGRVIRSSNLSQALQEGYAPLLPRGRFPVGAIRLFLPPDSFDVNVHPSKLEVRFVDTRPVFSLVYGAVSQALEQYQADTVQERHLNYSKSDASSRGATVPLRGLPHLPADGAKTAIDNLPASRPPGASTLNVPRPVRCRRDVDGKNHGLMGIINRIDAVNANLFPISASEKALARERENAQRSAESLNPELEGTIAVSMPHLAMRELAGYELLSKDGTKALAAAPKEPKPVFDGTDTIGVGSAAPSGFNGVDTLGCAEAQGISANSKGKPFSGTDTMGFDIIELPDGTAPVPKTAGFQPPVVRESAAKQYVADPLAATIIGLPPGRGTAESAPDTAPEEILQSASPDADHLASTLSEGTSAAPPAADPLASTGSEGVPASSPAADPLASTLSEGVPASSPAADPLASTLSEGASASPPAADPLASTLSEGASASSPAADPLAATVFEGAPASSPAADPLASTLSEGAPASSPAADTLDSKVSEGASASSSAADTLDSKVSEGTAVSSPAADPSAATVFEGASAASPAADPLAATVFEGAPAAPPAADPLAATVFESAPAAPSAADPLAATVFEGAPVPPPAADPLAATVFEGAPAASSAAEPLSGEQEEAVPACKAHNLFMRPRQEELPDVDTSAAQPAKSRFRLFGQVHNTFIVGLVDGELWVIDQHTAHERLNYERLGYLSPLRSRSQMLLVPETMDFSPAASEYLASQPAELSEFGFVVEPFGQNTFQLRAVPSALTEKRIQSVFRDLIEELVAGTVSVKRNVRETMREKLRAMTSCKAAVKAGEVLSRLEMQRLVEDMLKVEHSRYCPHGRPTRVIMDQRTLERLFHR